MSKPFINDLKRARLNAGLKQIDVAALLGFTSTDRISRWEKGQAFPHLFNLFKLARIYRVLPHELYADYYEQLLPLEQGIFQQGCRPDIEGQPPQQ